LWVYVDHDDVEFEFDSGEDDSADSDYDSPDL